MTSIEAGGTMTTRNRWSSTILLLLWSTMACSKTYRIGDYVMVMWRQEGPYPAYVLDHTGRRYRVHFDGYPDRCDQDVLVDEIVGVATPPVAAPANPPSGVSCVRPKPTPDEGLAQVYKAGDRVKVTWRGSAYPALILEVIARDRFRVSYEGHEAQWNETVSLDRIVGRL
jgi:hypothetical protein